MTQQTQNIPGETPLPALARQPRLTAGQQYVRTPRPPGADGKGTDQSGSKTITSFDEFSEMLQAMIANQDSMGEVLQGMEERVECWSKSISDQLHVIHQKQLATPANRFGAMRALSRASLGGGVQPPEPQRTSGGHLRISARSQTTATNGTAVSKGFEESGSTRSGTSLSLGSMEKLDPPPDSWMAVSLSAQNQARGQEKVQRLSLYSSESRRSAGSNETFGSAIPESVGESEGSVGRSSTTRFTTVLESARNFKALVFDREKLSEYVSGKEQQLRGKIRQTVYQKGPLTIEPTLMQCLIHSSAFNLTCSMMVILNSVTIGISVEQETFQDEPESWVTALGHICTAWFATELILRIVTDGMFFFNSEEDWKWNWFDTLLVLTSLADVVMDAVTSAVNAEKMDVAQTFKVFKMLRILRLFRMFRFFKELALLALMIADSLWSLLWAIVLLSMLTYVWALVLTQSATAYLKDQSNASLSSIDIDDKFGTIARSLYSLLLSLLQGVSWHQMSDSLLEVGPAIALFFFVYILFTMLAVLNIITGVFVDNALETGKTQRDWLIQREQKIKHKYLKELSILFCEMDEDDSGTVSWEEMANALEFPAIREYFTALGIETDDLKKLFELLDEDCSGEVCMTEFLDGCTRCKGDAKSIDIQAILHECRRLNRRMDEAMTASEEAATRAEARTVAEANQSRRRSMQLRGPLTPSMQRDYRETNSAQPNSGSLAASYQQAHGNLGASYRETYTADSRDVSNHHSHLEHGMPPIAER